MASPGRTHYARLTPRLASATVQCLRPTERWIPALRLRNLRQLLFDYFDGGVDRDHAGLAVDQLALGADERPGRVSAHPVCLPGVLVFVDRDRVGDAQLADRVLHRAARELLAHGDDPQTLLAVACLPLVQGRNLRPADRSEIGPEDQQHRAA